MKIILIIIDGLGDEPIPQFGNKTPLEAAKTPNLDFLAEKGVSGEVLSCVAEGKLPTSEESHLDLFGFDSKIYNPGRGVLETMGIGLKILAGDVCLRGNFATLDNESFKIKDRRAGRIEKTENLIKAISEIEIDNVKFLIGKAVSHRIGVIMRGKNLSAEISGSDPKQEWVRPMRIRALKNTKEAKFTAEVLNQFLEKSFDILKNHPLNKKRKLPANCILLRGAGKYKKIPGFYEKYGLKACCIAGGTLYKGIGKFLGMDLIESRKFTGLPKTDLKEKFSVAKKSLDKYDFVFCHIKAADNFAEDGDFQGKKDFIEQIDKKLKNLLDLKNVLIAVTGDHSTCSLLKRHCLEPLPVLVYNDKIKPDIVKEFSEKACEKGGLGKIKQINLMKKIMDCRLP